MHPHDFSVALRIRHPTIDPAELTRRLALQPEHAWRAGEPRHRDDDDDGGGGTGVYRESYWTALVPPAAGFIDPLLVLGALRRSREAVIHPQTRLYFMLLKMKRETEFWRAFAEQGGTIDCLVQVHTAECFQLEMSQALLLALVDLKVTLSIEVDGAVRAAA